MTLLEFNGNISGEKVNPTKALGIQDLKDLLRKNDSSFHLHLNALTNSADSFTDLFFLMSLRSKALAMGLTSPDPPKMTVRVAIIGAYSLYPLHALMSHLLISAGCDCEVFVGEYDNYISEIMEEGSPLYKFRPDVVCFLPSSQRCLYQDSLLDPRDAIQSAARITAEQLIDLTNTLHARTSAEVIVANYPLPARHDLGIFRQKTLASEWNFRKVVNLELGLRLPEFAKICDVEFLTNRRGALESEDPRGWFQSKQPYAASLLVDVAREFVRLILGARVAQKKVLVLDLDNTLWGGVVADDGLEGIEIGDTSPRGESFKAFQKYIKQLKHRGVLLAVCSKNDFQRAAEPFEKHPEMVLRLEDFVSFKANWEPKSDNIQRIADELRLGLDSFVFVDDNPAEIEIVRQFVPQVATILLSEDSSEYLSQLKDCRYFEPISITSEDLSRTDQYRAETSRESALASATDMESYLQSLEMTAEVNPFQVLDVARLAQLINKSNQFNLTTRRRTEGEVRQLIDAPEYLSFSVRLSDRFGDHGLISILIGHIRDPAN